MGLFNQNNDGQEKRPVNPNNMLMIRVLAIGYLMYCLYEMVSMYIEGSEDAPSLGLLIGAIVVFVGGSVWVAIMTYKQYKRLKAEQQAAYEEEERLEAARAEAEENEDEFADGEDAEENKD